MSQNDVISLKSFSAVLKKNRLHTEFLAVSKPRSGEFKLLFWGPGGVSSPEAFWSIYIRLTVYSAGAVLRRIKVSYMMNALSLLFIVEPPLASPALGHWGTCPLDFQLVILVITRFTDSDESCERFSVQ